MPRLNRIAEHLLHGRRRIIYLLVHTDIDFFPKTRDIRHVGRFDLRQGLLNHFRVLVNRDTSALHQANTRPSHPEDMRQREETHTYIFIIYLRNTKIVRPHRLKEVRVRQDNAFRLAGCS